MGIQGKYITRKKHSIDAFYMTQFQNHRHQSLVREVRIDQHPTSSNDSISMILPYDCLYIPWHCYHHHRHHLGHCQHRHLHRHWSHQHESLRQHWLEIQTFVLVVRLLDSCHGCTDDRFPQDVWLPIHQHLVGKKWIKEMTYQIGRIVFKHTMKFISHDLSQDLFDIIHVQSFAIWSSQKEFRRGYKTRAVHTYLHQSSRQELGSSSLFFLQIRHLPSLARLLGSMLSTIVVHKPILVQKQPCWGDQPCF